jgi:hypothetical protein
MGSCLCWDVYKSVIYSTGYAQVVGLPLAVKNAYQAWMAANTAESVYPESEQRRRRMEAEHCSRRWKDHLVTW